jgi:hypothetical protein
MFLEFSEHFEKIAYFLVFLRGRLRGSRGKISGLRKMIPCDRRYLLEAVHQNFLLHSPQSRAREELLELERA